MTGLLETVAGLIIEAGVAIEDIYETDFRVDTKDDASPITEADRRAHRIIRDGLAGIDIAGYSGLPFLSEEGIHTSFEERKTWKRYWLVDPLDGTKEFVQRNGEFTVNIALIEDSLPAAGWVYVPVTGVLYIGFPGEGAYRLENARGKYRSSERASDTASPSDSASGPAAVMRSAVRLPDKNNAGSGTLKIVASRSHLNDTTKRYIDTIQQRLGVPAETIQAGSSLKLCRIAEGSADLYPRFGPTMEWDTAAAHAVCRAAGCRVISLETNNEMEYNKADLHNPHFIAAPASRAERYIPSDSSPTQR